MPAEGPELRFHVAQVEDLSDQLVRLHLVGVDDDVQGRQPRVGGGLEGFVVLPFLELAVAGHHDHAPSPAEEALGPGDPPALGDAHSQRARVGPTAAGFAQQ